MTTAQQMNIFNKKNERHSTIEFVIEELPIGSKTKYRATLFETWTDSITKSTHHGGSKFDTKNESTAYLLSIANDLANAA